MVGVAGEEASGVVVVEVGGMLRALGSGGARWILGCAFDGLFGLCGGLFSSLIGCIDVIFRSCWLSSCMSFCAGDLGEMILLG